PAAGYWSAALPWPDRNPSKTLLPIGALFYNVFPGRPAFAAAMRSVCLAAVGKNIAAAHHPEYIMNFYSSAAQLLAQADGLLITAGAGMGIDSGLPDFRGSEGFWNAYPALGRARIQFE